jgi:hypothetical protein
MGVADRARKRMPQSGDYLEKDDLIRAQDEPFGVANVTYDEKGSNYGPRWVLSLIPWFDEQEGPQGLLTFTANPTRNPFFEDLQAQIEENENQPIGPLTVVKGKSQKGFRYYTLDDWTEGGPAGGPAPQDAPTPAPARPARTSAPAPQQPAPEATATATPPEPEKRKPGRPRKTATTATATSETTPVPAPNLPAARQPDPARPDEATHAQEVSLPKVGKAICPDCKQEVEGRILPDDSGRRFIIHPFCPVLNKATVVEVIDA